MKNYIIGRKYIFVYQSLFVDLTCLRVDDAPASTSSPGHLWDQLEIQNTSVKYLIQCYKENTLQDWEMSEMVM